MILRQIAYRVQMKSGYLTREVITHSPQHVGKIVKDANGRVFRVIAWKEIEYNGVALTKIYNREGK